MNHLTVVMKVIAWCCSLKGKRFDYMGESIVLLENAVKQPNKIHFECLNFITVASSSSQAGVSATIQRKPSSPNLPSIALSPNSLVQYSEVGLIRLKVNFEENVILSPSDYSFFLTALCDDSFVVVKLLSQCQEYKEPIVLSLIKVYAYKGILNSFFETCISLELEKDSAMETIFRANSIASKSIDMFMKHTGKKFLQAALKETIDKIFAEKKNCEINPTLLGKNEDIKENVHNLSGYAAEIFRRIFENANLIPESLRKVFSIIKEKVAEKYPDLLLPIHSTCISAFIFLRLICPAILSPKLFHLKDSFADPKTNRTLTLIAKIVQNAANLVEFADKEQYMLPMTDILISNFPKVCAFIYTVSEIKSMPNKKNNPDDDTNMIPNSIERELAFIARYVRQNVREKYLQVADSCSDLVIWICNFRNTHRNAAL